MGNFILGVIVGVSCGFILCGVLTANKNREYYEQEREKDIN